MRKKPEQKEFDQPGWEKFLKTDLGKALTEFVTIKNFLESGKDKLNQTTDLIMIEMEKTGQDYIKPQIDGIFYEFELRKSMKKLKFKRAKV